MFNRVVFGERLVKQRKRTGETQTALAKLIGVSPTQMGDMERGNTTTSFERLCLLCDHYGVTADYLLGRTDEES